MENSAALEELRKETEDSLKLLRSSEWKEYVGFLRRRAQRLQESINKAVDAGDIVEARINLGLMKDSLAQADVFRRQVLEKNSKLKKQENGNGQS